MTTIKNVHQHKLLNDLKSFIGGTSQNSKSNLLDLTKTALSLLKTLPAARNAIFEYFCTVFNIATQNYVVRIETEIATGQLPPLSEEDEVIVSEIHTVLCSFVAVNAEAWAPIISTWSLELLGELSTRFVGRAHVSTGVNETLQLWMSCRATRTLIDVTTQCLSCLIHSDTEACINALLDTSVKHSPNFDWVVAHVGGCFPNTVITRVLSCGLKDFCQNKSYEQGCDSPKLKSVVGILGHLAGSHCDDICIALLDLFNWSIKTSSFRDSDAIKIQKKATVPYLLQLAYLSQTLLSAICKDIGHTLTCDTIQHLYTFTDDWCKYFGSTESLEGLLVTLIMKCDVGGTQIINILLDCVFINNFTIVDEDVKKSIKEKAQEILEYIIQEMDLLMRTQTHQTATHVNLLESFTREIDEIYEILLSTDKVKSQTAARIIIFIGHNNPSILVKAGTFLFRNANSDEHLCLLLRILTSELIDKTVQPYTDKGGHFAVVLEQVFSEYLRDVSSGDCKQSSAVQAWYNLLILLRWEKANKVSMVKSQIISRAVHANLFRLTSLFESEYLDQSIRHLISKVLDMLDIPTADGHQPYIIDLQAVLKFTSATVNYFFVSCNDSDPVKKASNCARACKMLTRLCLHLKPARVLAIRELLERSLFASDNVLFGAVPNLSSCSSIEKLLLYQNRKNSKIIPITKHSSVYNGGIVGSGKRKAVVVKLNAENVGNIEHLMRAIKSCCALSQDSEIKNIDVSLDSLTLVSLLLVQFVSPDVMYNGLPWPEEEFSKVTIERDLYIRRLFGNTPLLWYLLSLVALYRPTLCYCSVLIRALTATLIHQWNSMGDQSKSVDTDNYKSLMDTTVKVIDIMALGQLLPPPLCGIRDVIPYLKCYEIVQIVRDCVWNYMRDHVPSPALFVCDSHGVYWRDPALARPPDIYVNTLRIIMQRNIKTVGHLYAQMFVSIPHADLG